MTSIYETFLRKAYGDQPGLPAPDKCPNCVDGMIGDRPHVGCWGFVYNAYHIKSHPRYALF